MFFDQNDGFPPNPGRHDGFPPKSLDLGGRLFWTRPRALCARVAITKLELEGQESHRKEPEPNRFRTARSGTDAVRFPMPNRTVGTEPMPL